MVRNKNGDVFPGGPALYLESLFSVNSVLVDQDGAPIPKHRAVLKVGQNVVVEGCTFRVAHIGDKHLLLEPAGIVHLDKKDVEK